jgi:tetratricopeptide (TPR) repeat protein
MHGISKVSLLSAATIIIIVIIIIIIIIIITIIGISCMRLERWDEATEAFTRCTQQDNDNEYGEAWANIGAIHMRFKDFNKAYSSLTEAYKIKHDSWRVLENLMGVCLALGKWQEAIMHMNTLLMLRNKSQRPVHKVLLLLLLLLLLLPLILIRILRMSSDTSAT